MSNTPARVPYARLSPATMEDVDRELQKIERQQSGLFQPTVITTARSPYAVKSTDVLILADATAGNVTVTFPDAARVDGMHVTVVKTDASANQVILSGTFNGVVNPILPVRYLSMTVDAGNGVYYSTGTRGGFRYRITTQGQLRVTTTGAYRIVTGSPT